MIKSPIGKRIPVIPISIEGALNITAIEAMISASIINPKARKATLPLLAISSP